MSPRKKQQNTKFTKFFSVRTPEIYQIRFFGIGPDPLSSETCVLINPFSCFTRTTDSYTKILGFKGRGS